MFSSVATDFGSWTISLANQPEDSYSSLSLAHLKKITRQKRFILPVLKRWLTERQIKDKMNKYIIMIN